MNSTNPIFDRVTKLFAKWFFYPSARNWCACDGIQLPKYSWVFYLINQIVGLGQLQVALEAVTSVAVTNENVAIYAGDLWWTEENASGSTFRSRSTI